METPFISIGMPVYNSEKYLRQALDSLLAQDYGNFELIISDNASTDHTTEICREYVKKDKRVQYYRNETNLGASYNFKRVFELASGEFFMWAGSHDLWTPDYISRLIRVLQIDPKVVLAYTETYWIDDDGSKYDIGPFHLDTRGMSVLDRVPTVIKVLYACDLFYGMYRTSVLKKCRYGLQGLGPDHVMLMEVSLLGEIAEIKGKGFLRRIFRSELINHSSKRKLIEAKLVKSDPAYLNRKNVRAYWEWGWQHLLGIWLVSISGLEKLHLTASVAKTFYSRFKTELRHEIFHPVFQKRTSEKEAVF